MSKLLLLPSARLVPIELRTEFGAIPSAMVPLDSRPAMQYIADPYREQGFDIVVAVHEEAAQVQRYLERRAQSIRAVDVGATSSLGHTVLRALEALAEAPEQLVINFADTYIGDVLPGGNVVCYHRQADLYRWTTFRVDARGQIHDLADKNLPKSSDGEPLLFVGVFAIADPAAFHALLDRHVGLEAGAVDPFYGAVEEYFNALPREAKSFLQVEDWRDFGHLDTYYDTRRAFYLNKRAFNQVVVDPRRGILRKTSTHEKKFTDEIAWYLRLPRPLQYMTPRVLDYSLDPSSPFVELEFYGYPALNDVYLFGDCDLGVWNQVFEAIDHVMADMATYRMVPPSPEPLREAMHDMYVQKTRDRLEGVLADPRFAAFCAENLRINGRNCAGLPAVLEALPGVVEAAGLYDRDHFSILHGDLCLSNVLFDPRHRLVRLIDPRGRFGPYDLYGDPRYDLAKLRHSIEGDYDFLLNDLFDLRWEEDGIVLTPYTDQRHLAIKALFRGRLDRQWGDVERETRLIESLLFLSMVPLHADRFRAQQAFLARGLELFASVVASLSPQEVAV